VKQHRRPNIVLSTSAACLVVLIMSVPQGALGDVAQPRSTNSEDHAGAALLVSNAVAISLLGAGLTSKQKSTSKGCLGVGLGLGTIALGVTDVTSFSDGVAVAGVVTTGLGLFHFVDGYNPEMESDDFTGPRQNTSVIPLLVRTQENGMVAGLLVKSSF
jgi:hypothetical protein